MMIDDFTTDSLYIWCLNVWLHILQSQYLTVSTEKLFRHRCCFYWEFTEKLPGVYKAVID